MISKEEARIGTTMSNLFVALILINFGIQVFVLGPDQVGYDPTWGPALSISGFALGFSLLFVFYITNNNKTFWWAGKSIRYNCRLNCFCCTSCTNNWKFWTS